jgi:hypothetical protein
MVQRAGAMRHLRKALLYCQLFLVLGSRLSFTCFLTGSSKGWAWTTLDSSPTALAISAAAALVAQPALAITAVRIHAEQRMRDIISSFLICR